MADGDGDKSTVSLATKLGTLSMAGKDALGIALLIVMLALGGLTIYEHIERSKEHDVIACQLKLTLYMQTQPIDKPIDWKRMPIDTFECVPRFLYERDQTVR